MQLKVLLLIYCFVFSLMFGVNAQRFSNKKTISLIHLFNKSSGKGFISDSIMISLQAGNDFIIGYSTYNYAWGFPDKYNLLLYKNNKWTALKYHRKEAARVDEPLYLWDSVSTKAGQIDSVLNSFVKNTGWTLSCFEEWGGKECPLLNEKQNMEIGCTSSDAPSARLIVMTKKNLQTAAFYDPAGLELCCPGSTDRNRFMSIVKSIAAIFKDRVILRGMHIN
jgi:hypothetical protein